MAIGDLLALALVIVTAIYVWHTARMVGAMKQRPYVSASCRFSSYMAYLVIENHGQRAAYDISLDIWPGDVVNDIEQRPNIQTQLRTMLRRPVHCIAPGQSIRFRIGDTRPLYSPVPRRFDVYVQYAEHRGPKADYYERFPIDLETYRGMWAGTVEEESLAREQLKALKELAGNVGKLGKSGAFGGVTVHLDHGHVQACPFCLVKLPSQAQRCPHCLSDLPPDWAEDQMRETQNRIAEMRSADVLHQDSAPDGRNQ